MTAALAWLAGTKAGRWVASAGAALLVAVGILARVYGAGRQAEVSKQADANLEALRSRNRTDEAVDQMGAARQRDELARWVQRDDR